jgi:hypothetical protein
MMNIYEESTINFWIWGGPGKLRRSGIQTLYARFGRAVLKKTPI